MRLQLSRQMRRVVRSDSTPGIWSAEIRISNLGGVTGANRWSVVSQPGDDVVCKHSLTGRDEETSTNRLEDCAKC